MTTQTNTPQDGGDELEALVKAELSKAYYNGLDRKGWSRYEEQTAVDAIINPVLAREREAAERARIDAIQLYIDTCKKEGVSPTWLNLLQFQTGQCIAYEHLHPKPQAGDGEGAV